MNPSPIRYLIVPGWQGSPAEHWQSHWQRALPDAIRVEQRDWLHPLKEEWIAQLERYVSASPVPVVVIAHSLGCVTLANWAAHTSPGLRNKVLGALLVAPADVERVGCPADISNFAPISRQLLPFPSLIIGSDNDSAATPARVQQLAKAWGASVEVLSGVGHINVKSGHRRWEQGFAFLYRLQCQIEQHWRQLA